VAKNVVIIKIKRSNQIIIVADSAGIISDNILGLNKYIIISEEGIIQ